MYMSRYYKGVFDSAEAFGSLVGKSQDDATLVKREYIKAIRAISQIAARYQTDFFPAEDRNTIRSVGTRDGRFFQNLNCWIESMNDFVTENQPLLASERRVAR